MSKLWVIIAFILPILTYLIYANQDPHFFVKPYLFDTLKFVLTISFLLILADKKLGNKTNLAIIILLIIFWLIRQLIFRENIGVGSFLIPSSLFAIVYTISLGYKYRSQFVEQWNILSYCYQVIYYFCYIILPIGIILFLSKNDHVYAFGIIRQEIILWELGLILILYFALTYGIKTRSLLFRYFDIILIELFIVILIHMFVDMFLDKGDIVTLNYAFILYFMALIYICRYNYNRQLFIINHSEKINKKTEIILGVILIVGICMDLYWAIGRSLSLEYILDIIYSSILGIYILTLMTVRYLKKVSEKDEINIAMKIFNAIAIFMLVVGILGDTLLPFIFDGLVYFSY